MYRWQWIPLICFAAAFLSTLAVLTIGRNRALGTDRRRELLRDLLRGPGESLRDPMQAAAWDAAEYAALGLFLMPLLFFLFPLQAVYAGGLPEGATLVAFLAAAALLPGWSVKRTAVSGIPVLAAWRIQAYFERMRPRTEMSDTLIERIAGQLEQRCRVVALVPAVVPATELSRPTVN